jgi:acyl-CoA thioesterase-1
MARQMVRLLRLLKVALALAITQGAPPATADDACRIAVLGDSLTTAYGLAVEDGFPAQLERRLREAGHDCVVLDAGVGGDTTAGGLARLDWMLADRPSHVIVELGGNDGLRALPPEQMEQNLDAIVSRLQAGGVAVLLAGMLAPPNLGRTYGMRSRRCFPRSPGATAYRSTRSFSTASPAISSSLRGTASIPRPRASR